MATGAYIGVSGKARKITGGYIGVDGKARKIVKAYVGVGGKAMLFWEADDGSIILEVEKITSNTYAGETTYNNEQFILLSISPKTNGTVTVTYGGLTKTITDTSGAAEPNAQNVFFGTFNGVSDSVETPASGTLKISGDYRGISVGGYTPEAKGFGICNCVTQVTNLGNVEAIELYGFGSKITSVIIPETVTSIYGTAFSECTGLISVTILAKTPPTTYGNSSSLFRNCTALTTITVPKGCGDTYKAATGWSDKADIIVEAS